MVLELKNQQIKGKIMSNTNVKATPRHMPVSGMKAADSFFRIAEVKQEPI